MMHLELEECSVCLDPLQADAISLGHAISTGQIQVGELRRAAHQRKSMQIKALRETGVFLAELEPYISAEGLQDRLAELDGQINTLQAQIDVEMQGITRDQAGLGKGLPPDWLPPHQPIALRCNHRFHSGCIRQWMGCDTERAKLCPCCLQPIVCRKMTLGSRGRALHGSLCTCAGCLRGRAVTGDLLTNQGETADILAALTEFLSLNFLLLTFGRVCSAWRSMAADRVRAGRLIEYERILASPSHEFFAPTGICLLPCGDVCVADEVKVQRLSPSRLPQFAHASLHGTRPPVPFSPAFFSPVATYQNFNGVPMGLTSDGVHLYVSDCGLYHGPMPQDWSDTVRRICLADGQYEQLRFTDVDPAEGEELRHAGHVGPHGLALIGSKLLVCVRDGSDLESGLLPYDTSLSEPSIAVRRQSVYCDIRPGHSIHLGEVLRNTFELNDPRGRLHNANDVAVHDDELFVADGA